ncbi:YraN family protein [Chitiniphilus eburneus]|uniref:UPF0102 protein FAZ21_00960 n=1 Tax=Chitiniphilus eburneus TaxID=2571148 RepID=A0A4U0QBX2_9NEIS|nr:YraN family protein [Chitiniphilus eburneus]TJZ78887.1 YraN family protein [Chitiniphilus eburneus]
MIVRGAAAETQAADYLTRHGLKIVARNWRCRQGEIDLIARDGDTLVFVEVRARADARFGGAAASITAAKQARVVMAARHYLQTISPLPPCRFDAVCVDGGRLQWLKGCFDAG